jgi:hypothetical protein
MTHRLLAAWSSSILISFAVGCAVSAKTVASPSSAPAPAAREAPGSTFPTPIGPAATTPSTGFADVNTDNSLISNGSVSATSENLLSVASGFRREVYRLGGRVFSEQVHFRAETEDNSKDASTATYRIKILPRLLPDVLDWLGKHSTITVQDVSSIVAMESEADAAIVRADVQARLDAISRELADPAMDSQYRAALEQERTKLIGAVIADPNALADNTKRVAVLDIRLEAPHPVDPYAGGKLFGQARGSFLGLGILGQTRGSRVGGGVAVGGRSPVSSFEVMGYAAPTMDSHAGVTVTVGFGSYSKAFGAGNRTSMNPYIGARLGYAYLEASYFAVAAEVGVELLKQRGIVWTVSARPMGLVGTNSQAAVEVGSSMGLAF